MSQILYNVTFAANSDKRFLHVRPCEQNLATVAAIDASKAIRACHYHDGKQIAPDYEAIRSALPHYHVKSFDRAGLWYFPATVPAPEITANYERKHAASMSLYGSKGRLLGTLYATPYLFTHYTINKES